MSKPLPIPNGPDVKTLPGLRAASTLPVAMLLCVAGGSTDAFTFLYHGHIFAAVMTGNAVMLTLSALQMSWMTAFHYLGPMAAFFGGLFASRLLDGLNHRHVVFLGLCGQALGIFLASFLPRSVPDPAFVSLIAFVTAFQVASFRKAGDFSYSSTFITSDLRTAADGLFEALHPAQRRQGLLKFRDLALVLLSFFSGATVNAFLGRHYFNHALWFTTGVLLCALAVMVRAARNNHPALDPSRSEAETPAVK